MRLGDMYPNYLQMQPLERELFIRKYRELRDQDLQKVSPLGKRRSERPSLELTPQEMELVKSLGLTPQKFMKLFRGIKGGNIE